MIVFCVFEGLDVLGWVSFIKEQAPELAFTTEIWTTEYLQFLDLNVFQTHGLCWSHGQVAPKPVLPFHSCHPKAVKRGIACSLLKSHSSQMSRLGASGCNLSVWLGVCCNMFWLVYAKPQSIGRSLISGYACPSSMVSHTIWRHWQKVMVYDLFLKMTSN